MSDIIRLLPDSIANQIAAGEVIQRPASVVKELLENAIDADSTRIQLIIKDAGKTLIQVIDNGSGMSDTDARMAFERHATSKIKKSEDLQHIRTLGFRGEALASMAAVAQVELKTRLHDRDLGTKITIAGSAFQSQEPCQSPGGTSFAVSNLFYNVPARRKFLKSDPVELRNIIEEFEHIALAYPELEMTCHHNDTEVYNLPKGNLRQRIIGVFGKSIGDKIVSVDEQTDLVNIGGFIGKVEVSKKKRGDQYLFVNRRYIRSSYLHHAIRAAYEALIAEEDHPFYVLFLDIDPTRIDVNVHPSKHEIKFLDERIIYQYIRVASRHALGQYVPLYLNFDESNPGFDHQLSPGMHSATMHRTTTFQGGGPVETQQDWRKLYDGLKSPGSLQDQPAMVISSQMDYEDDPSGQSVVDGQIHQSNISSTEQNQGGQQKVPYQIHRSYILSPIASGFLIIDQEKAHQRILYEKYLTQMQDQPAPSQRTLFPTTIQYTGADQVLLSQMLPQLAALGFEIEPFGTTSFIVHGMPMDWRESGSIHEFLETLLRQEVEESDQKKNHRAYIARYVARYQSIKLGQKLSEEEMQYLIDQLFACKDAEWGPFGGKCYSSISLEEIKKRMA